MFLWRRKQEEVNMGLIDGWVNRKSKAKGHRSQHQGWEVLSCSGTTWGQGDRPRLPPPRSPGQSECQKMPSIIILIIRKDENMNTHLSSKDLSALQISQVDRLLHLVLVAVSLVGGAPIVVIICLSKSSSCCHHHNFHIILVHIMIYSSSIILSTLDPVRCGILLAISFAPTVL